MTFGKGMTGSARQFRASFLYLAGQARRVLLDDRRGALEQRPLLGRFRGPGGSLAQIPGMDQPATRQRHIGFDAVEVPRGAVKPLASPPNTARSSA